MGASCISRPRPRRPDDKNSEFPVSLKETGTKHTIIHIQLTPDKDQLTHEFPFKKIYLQRGATQNIVSSKQAIKTFMMEEKKKQSNLHGLPIRLFSHSAMDIKKYFDQAKGQSSSHGKQSSNLISIPVILSSFYDPCISTVQSNPFEVQMMRPQQNTDSKPLIGMSILPCLHLKNTKHGLTAQKIDCFERVQELVVEKYQEKETDVGKIMNNSLINGLHWSQSKGEISQLHLLGRIFEGPFSGFEDEFLLYLNPQIRAQLSPESAIKPIFIPKSYLQLKSLLEGQALLNIPELFSHFLLSKSHSALYSVYLFMTSVKCLMEIQNSKKIMEEILQCLYSGRNCEENQLISDCINVLKILFLISEGPNQCVEIQDLCQLILKDVMINSHILIDAYMIQFSVEVSERQGLLRHQPFNQSNQPFSCRQLICRKPNLLLIHQLKCLTEQKKEEMRSLIPEYFGMEQKNGNLVEKVETFYKKWVDDFKTIISKFCKFEKGELEAYLRDLFNEEGFPAISSDEMMMVQYLLMMKIVKFLIISGLLTNCLSGSVIQLHQIGLIQEYWNPIFSDFLSGLYFFCSGELGITISTLQGLIKSLNSETSEEGEQYILKAIEIWNRTYRDPRSKHTGFLPTEWISYVFNILLISKSSTKQERSITEINYLRNILSIIPNGEPMIRDPQQLLLWVIENLPICNFSGLFYNRLDLMVEEDKSSTFIRTGGSFADSPYDQLSSKSNFSDSYSSGSLNKTRRKNRRKVNDSLTFLEHQGGVYGIFEWGKGVKSVPLLQKMTCKLDVLKISCGNYHTIIATSEGIMGWGENFSGQLGEGAKESSSHVVMVCEMEINSAEEVELGCGNEHSAVLLKETKVLKMWGQKEGGIIAGDNHKFDKISCGGLHTLGILDGEVFSWGRGEGGQLGQKIENMTTKKKEETMEYFFDVPTKIAGLSNIKKCVCGDAHSIALSENGDVFVFGFCYQGQLGLGLTGESDCFQVFEPVKLEFMDKTGAIVKVADIFAGSTFTFFKSDKGEVYSCGLNDYSQLGFEKIMKVFQKKKYISHTKDKKNRLGEVEFSKPKRVDIFSKEINVKEIICGENHCLAKVEYLKNGENIMGWGLNRNFQISNDIPSESVGPRILQNLHEFNFEQICCGNNFSYGLVRDPGLTRNQFLRKVKEMLGGSINLRQIKPTG